MADGQAGRPWPPPWLMRQDEVGMRTARSSARYRYLLRHSIGTQDTKSYLGTFMGPWQDSDWRWEDPSSGLEGDWLCSWIGLAASGCSGCSGCIQMPGMPGMLVPFWWWPHLGGHR